MAIRNVKRLQQKYDNTARPDFRLRRDLNDARAYLESVKARDKATRKAKPERMRAQLIEAEKEAYESLTAADKAREAAERAKRTAEESRQGTSIPKMSSNAGCKPSHSSRMLLFLLRLVFLPGLQTMLS